MRLAPPDVFALNMMKQDNVHILGCYQHIVLVGISQTQFSRRRGDKVPLYSRNTHKYGSYTDPTGTCQRLLRLGSVVFFSVLTMGSYFSP